MARKRKLDASKSAAEATERPAKQQQQQQRKQEQEQEPQQEQEQATVEEEQTQMEPEPEAESELQEQPLEDGGRGEMEEAEEERGDDGDANPEGAENGDGGDANPEGAENGDCDNSAAVEAAAPVPEAVGDQDDGEPIQNLLEPFTKDQVISLLREAAEAHSDVADRIRKAADEDPAHRKIFVHGLGWETTAETLISEFKQYGEIEDCKAVADKVSGKSKGYAFILFKTRKGARAALKQPQKKINNRMASCQLAIVGPVPPPTTAPQASQESEYTRRKIYVSNVGAELDPQKLLAFFAKYGEIEEGPLGLDKATGKPKGFCLFVYKTVESAKKALVEPHKNFEGHVLHCQKAIDGPKPGKGKHQQLNVHGNQFQRKRNTGFVGGSASTQGHLMAPSGAGMGFNQGAAGAQPLNPALGQALSALLSNPAAGLGLTNLLGTLGSAVGVNPGAHGAAPPMQGGYANQGMQVGGYGNQQMGQGGAGRGQHGVGHYGGVAPNLGH